MDGVKVALGNRGMTVEAAPMHERLEIVHSPGTYVTEAVSCGHFGLALCFFGPPSRALGLSHGEGRDAVT